MKVNEQLDRIIELLEAILNEVENPVSKELRFYQDKAQRENALRLKEYKNE